MKLENLRKDNKLIDLFCELVEIPSPSGEENEVAAKIIEKLQAVGINAKKDAFGNVTAKIPATNPSKKPIILSAHMDVVGDDSPVKIRLSNNSEFIETDKTRTLGADDKAGVAAAMMLATKIIKAPERFEHGHGGLELVFTKDEEQNMTGIHNIDFSELDSEYVLVLDSDKLGQIQISGASYTNGSLVVTTFKGGHSGIDIGDKTRLNAVKLIAELITKIPQGEYKSNEYGSVTSINIGSVIGGGVDPVIRKAVQKSINADCYIDYTADNSLTNIINTKAAAKYSIRSSESENEQQLVSEIKSIIEKFNKKYNGLAQAEFHTETKMKAFEKSDDETITKIAVKACKNLEIEANVSSFHAGAETHIYAHEKNKHSQIFKPYLIGLADIHNMHSSDEMIHIESFKKGYLLLEETFKLYNN